MTGASRIIKIRKKGSDTPAEDELVPTDMVDEAPEEAAPATLEPMPEPEPDIEMADLIDDDVPHSRGVAARLMAALAIIVALGWLGSMVALVGPQNLVGMAPVALAQLVAALCVPPALIGVIWLIVQRNSRAEAHRFADVARTMRQETEALERAMATISAQIDAKRTELAQQTNALIAMGEQAQQRLTAISDGMAHEVRSADEQARRLTDGITAAQASLSVLLSSLPRALGEAADMAKTIEGTGLSASAQTAALSAQLTALAERGREADTIAGDAAQKLAAHIVRMEATSETAAQRLEQVTGEMTKAVDGLLDRTAGAVDEARKGIAAQGDAMAAMVDANQAHLKRASTEAIEALAERITAIESAITRIGDQISTQRDAGAAMLNSIDSDFNAVAARISRFHSEGLEQTQHLAASISALGETTQAMTDALHSGDDMARKVISTAEDLLTSLDAAAREMDETLPEALARLDGRIGESRKVVAAAKPELLALVTAAESTHDAIEAIAQVLNTQRATLDQMTTSLNDALARGEEKANAVSDAMNETIARTADFTEAAAPRLVEALMRVRETASTAADRARETLETVIPEAAQSLELASAQSVRRAVGTTVETQIAELIQATDAAVAAAARASERLTQQMMTIAETTGLVESRIEEARAEREASEKESFGRRASLLIEALNSASIDIAKTFSSDVSDSAWAAYLKGDRGVFTRRAVRLLDAGEARDVARLYDEEPGFREQVNRYIHDFEAMLRAILAQRDGSPIGVTLLSSDMGKLYVALAQAIERLRS